MDPYIQISQLNDFVFCPKSIYFHNLYGKYNQSVYHEAPQIAGKIKHENIDQHRYSTEKRYLQGLEVFSNEFRLCGKIDILDTETGSLIERKNKIVHIYDGYKFQLYGQYFSLLEMGYTVNNLFLHSLSDNRRYPIDVPDDAAKAKLQKLTDAFLTFDVGQKNFKQASEKCCRCIYRELCDSASL